MEGRKPYAHIVDQVLTSQESFKEILNVGAIELREKTVASHDRVVIILSDEISALNYSNRARQDEKKYKPCKRDSF